MKPRPKSSAVIFAKNVALLALFYKEIAGMTEIHTDSDHVVLDEEGFQIVIHGIPTHIADAIDIRQPPRVRESTPLKLCVPVSSIEFARDKAMALGGSVSSSEREWEAPGFRACDGYDPEGNVFQVRESAG